MTSRRDRQGLARITAMVLLCSACGGEEGSRHANGGGAGVGATSSGGMGASGTTTGGLPASGAGGQGAGGSSISGSSNLGGSSGMSTVSGNGTVTDAWSGYCLATFASDYDVTDSFDDPIFTARTGEQYLMTSYPSTFGGPNSAGLLYLTEHGPFEFEVDSGSEPAPFTANCPKHTGQRSYAVFTDVSLYADATLATKLCDLTAGTALPLAGGSGYSLSSSGRCSGIDTGRRLPLASGAPLQRPCVLATLRAPGAPNAGHSPGRGGPAEGLAIPQQGLSNSDS